MKKIIIVIVLLLIILLAALLLNLRPQKSNLKPDNSTRSSGTVTRENSKIQYSTEEEKIVLNFKDTQVEIKGYPLIANNYVKIYHFIYVGMGGDENVFIKQETNVDQQGSYSYKLSSNQNRIFTGVGKDTNGQPIKQTMEIVPLIDFEDMFQDCQISDIRINNVPVKKISCVDFSTPACWIPVDEKSAIFYKQESVSKLQNDDTCTILQKNGIKSVSFQPYQN